MSIFSEILKVLNENTGVTLIVSALGFGFNEWIKTRNLNKVNSIQFKAENIDIETLKREKELYLIFSNFCLSSDFSEAYCISKYDEIRLFVINNDLFLREDISKLGSKFANYILDDVSNGQQDLQKQETLLKEFKKKYRN